MKVAGIIPARYASTRLPGKPLADLVGKTLIQRVYENARSFSLDSLIIATDDDRIAAHAKSFGADYVMTSPSLPSGTDRCAEATEKLGLDADVIVNIQGDEPFLETENIDTLIACFQDEQTDIATLGAPITEQADLSVGSVVKLVTDDRSFAIYFSRSPIPFIKEAEPSDWLSKHSYTKHLGVYAYRLPVLDELVSLKPSKLELLEGLEQLRWLENGYKIKVAEVAEAAMSIDTPADLEAAIRFIYQSNQQ